ncbi:MAG: porin family protein [Steroidobacteraceae bacterium]
MKISALKTPLLCASVAAASLATAGTARAADYFSNFNGLYLGGQFSQFDYQEHGYDSATPSALGFLVGYDFNPNLALEARVGSGLSSDGVPSGDGVNDVTFKLKSYSTLALKGTLPISDIFGVYGLLGVSNARVQATYLGAEARSADSGASYGFGVEFTLGPARNLGLSAEWTRILSTSDYSLDQLSVGLRLRF